MPAAVSAVTGDQVRAYRILASGLARTAVAPANSPLWDLGIQDRDGSSRLALADAAGRSVAVADHPRSGRNRRTRPAVVAARSPHLHRRADAARFAAALWPADDADAAARLSGDAGRLHGDGADPLQAYQVVSDAMREVITAPMVKGAASAAVTAAIPAEYSGFCRACGSVHVREMLFRVAALPAAVGLVADTKPVVLEPLSRPSPERRRRSADSTSLVDRVLPAYGVGTAGGRGDASRDVGALASADRCRAIWFR